MSTDLMPEEGVGGVADLILHNARVITLDAARPRAGLVVVKGNRILATGEETDLDLFRGAGTRLVDCEGGSVIPGFNDAHCHPLPLAVSLLSVDCSPRSAATIADIQARIRARAEQTEEGTWIRASGYDEFRLHERRTPNRRELDHASPRHPVILVHHTAGHCILNSLAMKRAGITRDTQDPPGGRIHRDPGTGEPDGRISGRNAQVEKAIPPIGDQELERGVKLASREYLARGITSIQDTGWNNGTRHWRTWKRLVEREAIAARVAMMVGAEALEECTSAGLSMGTGDSRLRVTGVKLALDESTGCPHPPQQDVNRLALLASRAGFCVAFHVSDVAMLETSLAAMRFVRRELPEAACHFRLEHCTICPPALLPKIRASGAIVVTQPSFLWYMGEPYRNGALPHQAGWFQPLASFRRWGVEVALSSDSPMVPSDPLTGVYAAVSRKTESGQVLASEEGISVLEALEMYTLGGALASFEADAKGSIRPGKLADLAVLDGDLARVASDRILDLKVVRCVIDGKIVASG